MHYLTESFRPFCIFVPMKNGELHTLIDLLERSCLKFPENAYLWEKREGGYRSVTYRQTRREVGDVAAGLLADLAGVVAAIAIAYIFFA